MTQYQIMNMENLMVRNDIERYDCSDEPECLEEYGAPYDYDPYDEWGEEWF